jgi:hypothetical protein
MGEWGWGILTGGIAGGLLAPPTATTVDTCRLYLYMRYEDGTALAVGTGSMDIRAFYGATTFNAGFSAGTAAATCDANGYVELYAPRGQEIGLRLSWPDATSGATRYQSVRFTVPDAASYDVSAELNYG